MLVALGCRQQQPLVVQVARAGLLVAAGEASSPRFSPPAALYHLGGYYPPLQLRQELQAGQGSQEAAAASLLLALRAVHFHPLHLQQEQGHCSPGLPGARQYPPPLPARERSGRCQAPLR